MIKTKQLKHKCRNILSRKRKRNDRSLHVLKMHDAFESTNTREEILPSTYGEHIQKNVVDGLPVSY